jgi:hypothetical protein
VDAAKRRALEARRAEVRDRLAREKVRQWMLRNYSRAEFDTEPDDRIEQIFRALGR